MQTSKRLNIDSPGAESSYTNPAIRDMPLARRKPERRLCHLGDAGYRSGSINCLPLPYQDSKTGRLEFAAFLGLAVMAGITIFIAAGNAGQFAINQSEIVAALSRPQCHALQAQSKLWTNIITDDMAHKIW